MNTEINEILAAKTNGKLTLISAQAKELLNLRRLPRAAPAGVQTGCHRQLGVSPGLGRGSRTRGQRASGAGSAVGFFIIVKIVKWIRK